MRKKIGVGVRRGGDKVLYVLAGCSIASAYDDTAANGPPDTTTSAVALPLAYVDYVSGGWDAGAAWPAVSTNLAMRLRAKRLGASSSCRSGRWSKRRQR
jgi:hypothetical protein